MQIEMQKIASLIPYDNNPRINDGAVDAVANSIREFGFKNPIIVDKNNVIVAGHTRLKAARKLGLSEVPTIRADDLTPDQINAFRLADNRTSEFSLWDFPALQRELDRINTDMAQFGFETVEEEETPKIEKRPIRPFVKVHYLITADLDLNPEILERLESLKNLEGVEIESSLN